MEDLIEKTLTIKGWLVEIRRDFHQYPELGFEEIRTQSKIVEYLNNMGIENKRVAKTGVVGIIRGSKDGKTVGLRADIDGLPMMDRKKVDYRSKNPGKIHACGHDAHTSILLGAARILNDIKDEIKGNIKLFFQPAEETTGGAKPMIEEGVLEKPYVDGIFGLHVNSELEIGKIEIKYGQMKAGSDMINIILEGENSHGAYPHEGVDPIVIAGSVINGIQTIISRTVDPRESAVISLGTIHGGYGRNIIADRIVMEGIVRTLNEKSRERVFNRLNKIIVDIPRAMGGRGSLVKIEGYTSLINNDSMVDIVKANGKKLLSKGSVYKLEHPSYGVEDFAFFAEQRPSAFFNLGTGNKKKNIIHKIHTTKFDIDEDALVIGVQIQVMNALRFLEKWE